MEVKIVVLPPAVPTTSAPFHERATHVDALGMPVAYEWDKFSGHEFSWHPTPCCGACASVGEWGFYCKACYGEVDPAYGNVPVEPVKPREV